MGGWYTIGVCLGLGLGIGLILSGILASTTVELVPPPSSDGRRCRPRSS